MERIGSKGTLFYTGLLVTAASACTFLLLRKRSLAGGLLAAAALTALFTGPPSRSFRPGVGVVAERESPYQYVRVRKDRGPEGTVYLEVDEGLDSFQSLYVPGKVLTGGQYYDYLALLPPIAGMEAPRRVCILGLGGGTCARQYERFYGGRPGFHMDGVEIDPVTVEMGRRYLGLAEVPGDALTVYTHVDARTFLRAAPDAYDVIIVDAYARQLYIPFHLATREFFREVQGHLTSRGIFGMNVGGFFHDDTLLQALAGTAAAVFGSVSVSRIPRGRNFMLFAKRGVGALDLRSLRLPPHLAALQPRLEEIARYGVTRRVAANPAARVLTDAHAPIASLCRRDLLEIGRRILGEE